MNRKLLVRLLGAVALLITVPLFHGCKDITAPIPVVPPPSATGLSFSVVPAADTTIIAIQIRWNAVGDANGTADSYLHTMTASKVVTDAFTGPLPTLKSTTGTKDTVRIKMMAIGDTVTLTSKIWSVRRGMQSTLPATGILFVKKGDIPPPPPDSVRVDTLFLNILVRPANVANNVGDTARFCAIYQFNDSSVGLRSKDTVYTVCKNELAKFTKQNTTPLLQRHIDSLCVTWNITAGAVNSPDCPTGITPSAAVSAKRLPLVTLRVLLPKP